MKEKILFGLLVAIGIACFATATVCSACGGVPASAQFSYAPVSYAPSCGVAQQAQFAPAYAMPMVQQAPVFAQAQVGYQAEYVPPAQVVIPQAVPQQTYVQAAPVFQAAPSYAVAAPAFAVAPSYGVSRSRAIVRAPAPVVVRAPRGRLFGGRSVAKSRTVVRGGGGAVVGGVPASAQAQVGY